MSLKDRINHEAHEAVVPEGDSRCLKVHSVVVGTWKVPAVFLAENLRANKILLDLFYILLCLRVIRVNLKAPLAKAQRRKEEKYFKNLNQNSLKSTSKAFILRGLIFCILAIEYW